MLGKINSVPVPVLVVVRLELFFNEMGNPRTFAINSGSDFFFGLFFRLFSAPSQPRSRKRLLFVSLSANRGPLFLCLFQRTARRFFPLVCDFLLLSWPRHEPLLLRP